VKSHVDSWADRSEKEIRGVGGAGRARGTHKDYEVWEAEGGLGVAAKESAKAEGEREGW